VDSVRFGTGVFVFWVKVLKDSCEGFDSITISIQKHVPFLKLRNQIQLLSFRILPVKSFTFSIREMTVIWLSVFWMFLEEKSKGRANSPSRQSLSD
jgi:hypothetical protein